MTSRLAVAVALLPALATAADPVPLPAGAFARLGSAAWLHPEQPLSVAVHPSGKVVASGGSDGVVRVWDAATGTVLHTIPRKGGASALAYSADGKCLAAHFGDELIRLFETDKYTETKAVPVKNGDHLGLSADGKLLVASGPLGQAALLEVESGQDRMELPKGRVAAVMPSGAAVAVANEVNAVHVLEVPSGKPLQAYPLPHGDTGAVSHIAYHPDGKRLAIATSGKAPLVRVFDLDKKEPTFSIPGEGPLAFVGETALAGRSGGRLAVWDAKSGKLLRTMGDGVTTLSVSADGRLAATDGGADFPSPRIHLWDLTTGESMNRTPDDLADLRGFAPHPARGVAVAAGSKFLTWPLNAAKPTLVPGLDPVRVVAPFGRSLVVATDTGKVLDVDSPDKPFAGVPLGVRFLAADAHARLIAAVSTGESPELAILDAAKGEAIRRWPLTSRPLAVAVDPAGGRVAILGRDGYARVWATDANGDGKTPAELWKERTARSFRGGIAFSPDGSRLAFTSLMRVCVHDAATGKMEVQFDRTWDDGPFTSVAFGPDGRFLAAGTQGTGGAGVVWELVTHQRAGRYPAGGTVTGVAFLDSGRTLVTAGADDNLLAWDRTRRRGKPAPTATELAAAWLNLGDVNPETAYPATATLAAGGRASVAFVTDKLAGEKELNKSVAKWVSELGAREFQVREAATKELIAVGGPVLSVLEMTEKTPQSAEWTQRAKTVRGRIGLAAEALPDPALVGVALRWVRVAAALDEIADPAATAALKSIRDLGGPAGEEAARVLKRRAK